MTTSHLDLGSMTATVIVTDGVYGTELQALGLQASACPESLNLTNPSIVEAVARSYVRAGSDVILTNTLSCHRFGLAPHGLGDRAAETARAAVEISLRAAAGSSAKVFGSFGPSGKVLMMGDVREEDLSFAFGETAAAMASAGAEAIVLETFNDLTEARIALQAVRRA